MWGIYILLTVASTCSNMPYGALNGCITPNTDDRNKVSNLRMLFANTSSMVTIIIAVPPHQRIFHKRNQQRRPRVHDGGLNYLPAGTAHYGI